MAETEIAKKRKTTTSTAVKRRYNAKVYAGVSAQLPKQLVADFKALAAKRGDSMAGILKAAVEAYIKENS